MSDTLSAALRVLTDQCVWNLASQLHNERKWEFNTNFLTKSATPPPSDGGLTSKHPRFAITTSRTTAECHKQVKHACPGAAGTAASSVANTVGVKFTDF